MWPASSKEKGFIMSQQVLTGIAVCILVLLPIIFWVTMAAHRDAIGE